MNANDPPEGNLDPNHLEKTRVVESDPGSGTPLHAGGVLCHLVTPPAIPDHELLRVIGHGAYGEVWLARNIMGAYRAVKIVFRDTFESDRPYEREFSGIQSFEPISRSHESQVDILHVGRNETERYFYYVMELADDVQTGRQIAPDSYKPRTIYSELKRRGRFAHAETLEICLALTTAVEHLHKHGLIHRDIKPANVIFLNGLPKLADIGLVTETGGTMSFVGTEGYLPPEGPGSVQADIFSLGKTLYEVATGKDRMEFPELPTITDSSSDEAGLFELNEVLLKACHPDKQGRYRDAGEMRADLVLLQAGKSVRRSRAVERRLALLTRVSVAGVVITSLLVAGYVYQQFQTREARRLAQENQKLASKETAERTRAEGLLNTLQLKEAEHFFENDDAGKGVAYLAHLLRQNPSNHIAATRLMSALTDRSFALPRGVFEHSAELGGADFSVDGQRIVTWGGNDTNGFARIWNISSGELISKPMRHEKAVLSARFSPDGRYVATASADGTVRIWDAATGEPVSKPLIHEGTSPDEPTPVWAAEFSADSQTLMTSSGSNVRVWKVSTAQLLTPPMDHGAAIEVEDFSPNGQRIVTRGANTVKIWLAATGKLERELHHDVTTAEESGSAFSVVQFSPDGSRILANQGKRMNFWRVSNGELLHRFQHEGVVTSAQFSPDGLRIVATDRNQAARVWDAQTGQLLIPPIMHKGEVRGAQFDPTGERLLTHDWQRVRIWDSRSGRPLTEPLAHFKGISSARFSPDGLNVLTITMLGERSAVLWDARPSQAFPVVLRHQKMVVAARFSGDGEKVVTSAGGDVFVRFQSGPKNQAAAWDAGTGEPIGSRIETTSGVQYGEFAPDGHTIVSASNDGQARVWDARAFARVIQVFKHDGPVRTARFSADGQKLVTASYDGTARIWEAGTGHPLTDPLFHTGQVWSAEFSPDARLVLTVSGDGNQFSSGKVLLWDIQTRGPRELEASHQPGIVEARFSPDGRRIVTASQDSTARVWDVESGKPLTGPLKHQAPVWPARFSPDGRYVVTGSEDQTARIWDALTGEPLTEPLRHNWIVISAQFSHDSRRVVTASLDGTARVWDVPTGRPLTEPLRHGDWVAYAEFSPDGRRVITASSDGTARIWELSQATIPVPVWLPDLAEAVVGQRLDEREAAEPVPPAQFLAIRKQRLEGTEMDAYTSWAKWLLADRATRNISWRSSVTVSTHLDRLIQWNSAATLREALWLSPDNADATSRLAREVLKRSPKEYPEKENAAAFLAERAVKLDDREMQAWWARAEVAWQAGQSKAALDHLEAALVRRPDSLELWTLKGQWLEQQGRDHEALLAYDKTVVLTQPSKESNTNPSKITPTRKSLLFARAKLLRRLGREEAAKTNRLEALGIPPRDSALRPELITLDLHYNAGLADSWHGFGPGNDLATLPTGAHTLAGVRWDVRGLIQVGGTSESGDQFPNRVSGISVGFACQRIHFLHAAIRAAGSDGVQIGKYVAHFADGREIEIPLALGRDLNDWWNQPDEQSKPFVIAWTGMNAASAGQDRIIRLFRTTWVNPTPQVALRSIDLVSTHDRGAPFLVAITAQTEPTPKIGRQPASQTLGAGARAVFEVEAESEAPLRYQWRLNGSDIPGATNKSYSIPAVSPKDAGTYTVQVWNAIEDSVLTLTSEPANLVVKTADLIFGVLRREVYTNISGSKLTNLTASARFPNNPDTIDLEHQFETPSNFAENYGVRLTGYLVPPKTGPYRLFLNSDDEGALFLSTDDSPENKRQIAHEPEWNGPRMWTLTKSRPKRDNVSEPIHLEAGRRYYIEALMKEGESLDNLAVTWQMPGEPPPENFSPPIPGTYLAVPGTWMKSPSTPLASGQKESKGP